MSLMDQGVAAVVAAGVAGTVAVAGSFIGVWVGRRQVRDQAKVEHEQWLRGQRQEAFVDFLALWDEAVAQLGERTLNEYEIEILDQEDGWDTANEAVAEQMHRDRIPVARAGERVAMLGPRPVALAATAMMGALEDLAVGIGAQYLSPGEESGSGRYDTYWQAKEVSSACREEFVAEAYQAAADGSRHEAVVEHVDLLVLTLPTGAEQQRRGPQRVLGASVVGGAGQGRKFFCHSSEFMVSAASARVLADGVLRLARLVSIQFCVRL